MASGSGGLSGTAVATAALGAVMVYAGMRGVSPIAALRDVAGGHPAPVVGHPLTLTPTDPSTPTTGSGSVGGIPASLSTSSRATAGAVGAAARYSGDVYSQAKRTQPGYSDCSSFVDKALTDAG